MKVSMWWSMARLLLVCHFEAQAGWTDVDVGGGGFAGDGGTEGEEGDLFLREELAQPDAFGSVGVQCDIDASAVVEAEGAVDGGFARGV